MNVFAKFDEIPSKNLKVIKETKRNGHTHTHNVKTVYPPTNTVCGGYNDDHDCILRPLLTIERNNENEKK